MLIAEHQLYPRILAEFVARERDPDWIASKVGELALALPETRFKTSHGSPGWKVGSQSSGKFFAIMWIRHHGEDSVGVLVKCSGQDEMAALIEADPDALFPPGLLRPVRLDRHPPRPAAASTGTMSPTGCSAAGALRPAAPDQIAARGGRILGSIA